MSVNYVITGLDKGLSPIWRQPILIWNNTGLLSTGLLRTNFSEIWIEIQQGKSDGFDSCDRPSISQIGFKSSIFQSM